MEASDIQSFGDFNTRFYTTLGANIRLLPWQIEYYRRYSRPTSQCPMAKMVAVW